jgi:hypothetical protein
VVTSLNRGDWISLGASAALLFNAGSGLITGSAIVFNGVVRRAEDPVLYWTAVMMSAGMGIALVFLTLF